VGKERARTGIKCGEFVAGWFVVTTRGRLAFSGDLFPSCFPANSLNISHTRFPFSASLTLSSSRLMKMARHVALRHVIFSSFLSFPPRPKYSP
jgi:hypothetical protein